ncbi:Crp/Fnr family transcriptional regulator [Fulvivirgaceae bacterium BMA12]|uniref:Crp/Fnr family transcriptional regulator n=1 Tax=Agaribacillus aureus TaxID=3051825 RepID=A0ABT8L3W5_9BACT|nr:Crp/Fnr family transcriptional regulator [Fulvivirgaceae bacterium BMA12]
MAAQLHEDLINRHLSFLGKDLLGEILNHATLKQVPAHTEILRQGQYVKVIPLVLEGLVKVFTRYGEKELLLYYIQADESCIMSFAAALQNNPSEVFAATEEESTVLLLPTTLVPGWIRQYPALNNLFYHQYNQRYSDLLSTINHLLFDKLDKRIIDYLSAKATVSQQKIVRVTHRQIANDLGTAREVISRIIKKLETDNLLLQHPQGIEIL